MSFQNISSTTLFNFTDTYDHLISNLTNGFYCGDIYEKISISKNIGYRVPMVCFCDIPLGQIKYHLTWYGNFGIGIKREYARELGVNPVWYYHRNNIIIKNLLSAKNRKTHPDFSILPFLKQFLGYQKNTIGVDKLKKFYDEREWRYVPLSSDLKAELLIISHQENVDYVLNNKRETVMPIPLDKIEYIIVDNHESKLKLYKVLENLAKKRNFNYEDLVSSIITCNQIRKDF